MREGDEARVVWRKQRQGEDKEVREIYSAQRFSHHITQSHARNCWPYRANLMYFGSVHASMITSMNAFAATASAGFQPNIKLPTFLSSCAHPRDCHTRQGMFPLIHRRAIALPVDHRYDDCVPRLSANLGSSDDACQDVNGPLDTAVGAIGKYRRRWSGEMIDEMLEERRGDRGKSGRRER